MIWPFKREPAMSLAEYAATQPPVPCGQPEDHYNWKLQGIKCPICARREQTAREAKEKDEMAERIAAAVVRKLQENKA